ncbi:MAG TPA: hypothetical protein VGX21_20270 [Methylomirabilota bacterium]|jgi:hypothetical protein|nr:hypothetical protein [Methylomirabilota bacterium]
MLNRLLVVFDILLLIGAGALGVHLYRVGTAEPSPARAPAPAPPASSSTPSAPPGPAPPPGSLAAFTVVAERNLFSPTRNEAGPEPPKPATVATPTAPNVPKPRLYGIVIGRDGGPRAYLEDPRTRKVFAYGVGDTVADSRVERIGADRVVLRRGGEAFEVLLRDPSKPKPAPAPPPGAGPGGLVAPGTPPGAGVPGVPPFGAPGTAPPGSFPFGIPGAGAGAAPGQPSETPGQSPFLPGVTAPEGQATPPGQPRFPARPPIRRPGVFPGGPSVPTQPQYPGASGS